MEVSGGSSGGAKEHARPLYAAIEAGGTKVMCGLGYAHDRIVESTRIRTQDPATTLEECLKFFRRGFERHGAASAMGIAAFGALDPRPDSGRYGWITETPKDGWRNTDFAGVFSREFGIPVGFDTDVNAAALAEYRYGERGECRTLVYFTVGTGIGAGAVADGQLVHGRMHPEMGHYRPPRASGDESFAGICRYHGDCLEGLACGPAIRERWGIDAEALPADHPAWVVEAHYLAHAVVTATALLAPDRIVLGGGVMHAPGLLGLVKEQAQREMAGYFSPTWNGASIADYIRLPELGDNAGLAGAIALAEAARLSASTPSTGRSCL